MEGHEWIRANLGAAHEPRIGWSLDPFGMSTTQATLQAAMGMDAWFFTRLSADAVEERKRERSLEFVWRASSSLPANISEIFCHVFESYYCMPSEFQFEWSAPPLNATSLLPLARKLAAYATNRSAWYRTRELLIPWGCDCAPIARSNPPTRSVPPRCATADWHTRVAPARYARAGSRSTLPRHAVRVQTTTKTLTSPSAPPTS